MTIPSETSSRVAGVIYAMVMAAIIVGVDVAFFRGRLRSG